MSLSRRLLCALIIAVMLASVPIGTARADTYTSQPDGANGLDTYIASDTPTTNFGGDGAFRVGEHNASTNVGRGLIKFDLSSIPATAVVSSATLSLWQTSESANNSRALRVYRVKRAWVEGEATWNIYATASNWQTAGGFGADDTEQTDIGSLVLSGTEANGQKDWSLDVDAIEEMIDGTWANNGFMLKADVEADDRHTFRSSDDATAAERPQLVIEYTVATDTPTATPTETFTATLTPSNTPTDTPTATATDTPTATATDTPTATATDTPSATATDTPTATATDTPSATATDTPSATATDTPAATATDTPGPSPTPSDTPIPPSATFTPTITLTPACQTLTLSSGTVFSIDCRATYGDIWIAISVIALANVFVLRWIYDFVLRWKPR